ncbi:phospholipase A2 inhibitor 25 kDa subunit-like [Dendropsophus ebraccatus]|uniref:phospholipase A2 inhibitor 25 kDa subunit-like n=1 Tax=Dendropsophus ebraccatus TaxID=150705 RepID=UPI003831C339
MSQLRSAFKEYFIFAYRTLGVSADDVYVLKAREQCTQCMAFGLDTCTEGPAETCQSGQVCTSTYILTTKDGNTDDSLFTGCGPTSLCNKTGSYSIMDRSVRMGVSCCSTDNCTSPLPTVPPTNNRRNGKVCQVCGDANEACKATTTMECAGSEDRCFLLVNKITEPAENVESYRGCATKSFCDIASQKMDIGIVKMEMKYLCNGGASAMYRGLEVFTVTALVMLMLLN